MKCCAYTTRDLRVQFTLERVTETPDGQGGNTRSWATEATVWGAWNAVGGREAFVGMRETPYVTVKAAIRFRDNGSGAPYYTTADRVLCRGRYYGIQAVRDPDGRKRWLEMDLLETDGS